VERSITTQYDPAIKYGSVGIDVQVQMDLRVRKCVHMFVGDKYYCGPTSVMPRHFLVIRDYSQGYGIGDILYCSILL
jgi:hypothetical protein